MTSNAVQAIQCIFSESWRFFNSWHIPGTNISPASWLIFAVVFYIGLKMVFGILGMTGVFGAYDTSGAIKTYRQGGHSDADLARYDRIINGYKEFDNSNYQAQIDLGNAWLRKHGRG